LYFSAGRFGSFWPLLAASIAEPESGIGATGVVAGSGTTRVLATGIE
jgi:hypothetical protein